MKMFTQQISLYNKVIMCRHSDYSLDAKMKSISVSINSLSFLLAVSIYLDQEIFCETQDRTSSAPSLLLTPSSEQLFLVSYTDDSPQ